MYSRIDRLEECRNALMNLGVREITPPSIARALGMMAKTPAGVSDSISVQVSLFTQYLRRIAHKTTPHTSCQYKSCSNLTKKRCKPEIILQSIL